MINASVMLQDAEITYWSNTFEISSWIVSINNIILFLKFVVLMPWVK